MAAQNRTLGRFELMGIPPAPRGVPQIEVTFDIDANGIVHVSAKDLGTGKEQKIRIEASSGLNESEIEKMVKDAEAHASEDKAARERAEVRNEADSLVYTTEKTLGDLGDKIDESERGTVQTAVDAVKKALESDDTEAIKARVEELKSASHGIAQKVYQQAQGAQAGGPGAGAAGAGFQEADFQHPGGNGAGPNGGAAGGSGNGQGAYEDVDYEVVNEDK
jgi:molecular chaperone DnaK